MEIPEFVFSFGKAAHAEKMRIREKEVASWDRLGVCFYFQESISAAAVVIKRAKFGKKRPTSHATGLWTVSCVTPDYSLMRNFSVVATGTSYILLGG